MKSETGPGFAVLYRWQVHTGKEEQFIEAWTRISTILLQEPGALGSRLHQGADGLWYSYAQWSSQEARENAFLKSLRDPEATVQMREAIAESFPEVILKSVADFMILPVKNTI